MRLRYGRHKGVLIEVVLLRYPDYVEWILASGRSGALFEELSNLVTVYDKLPLRALCHVCWRPAGRVYAYSGQTSLFTRCDDCCLARSQECSALADVGAFNGALGHAALTVPRGRRLAKRAILRNLTRLKGGPARITERSAQSFLSGAPRLPQSRTQVVLEVRAR